MMIMQGTFGKKLLAAGLFALALIGLSGKPAMAQQALTAAEVQQVIAQAVSEAGARGVAATIAVTDRVGNVLGVFRMTGAATSIRIGNTARTVNFGLDGLTLPDDLAGVLGLNAGLNMDGLSAIAKAVTGAYLSSSGNAFTTRTAGQIVQEHFNPGEVGQPSGPLFGVQFSQLPCSDLSVRQPNSATVGPKRSPLGLSADPGGLPLYKNGVVVGGIGVISDGNYGVDLTLTDVDSDNDEIIALAGQSGFTPPTDIIAERITVEGKTFRYTDVSPAVLQTTPANAPAFAAINGVQGTLVNVTGYGGGAIVAGQAYGQIASGFAAANAGGNANPYGTFGAGNDVPFVLFDNVGNPRFAPRAGTVGTEGAANTLTQAEVTQIVTSALNVAFRARAQIRRPLNSHAQVTVSLVDTNGVILAMARTPDGPIFGTDVSLQKARTAAFFSNTVAANELNAAANNNVQPLGRGNNIPFYVTAVRNILGNNALADGTAFADRSGGNLARPFLPDGIPGTPKGPLSVDYSQWSPFSVGLQLDLVFNNILTHLGFVNGLNADTGAACTGLPNNNIGTAPRIPNGIQIFPGSVPIYRRIPGQAAVLIGGLGVSGDGIDQDDMISFLGLHNASVTLANGVGNAPKSIRADRIRVLNDFNLSYVNCPFKPFIDSDEQSVCEGK